MSYLQEVDLSGALPAFVSFQEHFGVVPNIFRVQSLVPRILQGEAEIIDAVLFKDWNLSRTQKEYILLAVGVAYRATYCVALHYQVLLSLGVPAHQLDQIVINYSKAAMSTSDAALLDFAIKLAMYAPWLSGEDIDALRDHGFNDESILEAILVTGLASFLCTLSTGLSPSPDFEPRACLASNHMSPPETRYVGGTGGPYLRTVERSPESFPPFAIFLERFGFIPNLFRAQTLRPDVLEAEVELFGNVLGPQDFLSHVQKECILLVASGANLNTYCVADHCEMLRAMGVSMEESDQIVLNHHEADLSKETKALLDFVLKLALRRSITSEDIANLRGHGFAEEHILETVAVTALNNFLNTLQMGLGTTPDVKPRHVYGLKDALFTLAEERPQERSQIDPDASLVARVKAGDLNAFEELVARHSRRVHRTLVGIVGNVPEAQDAFQETFLKAFRHLSSFQGRSTFSTWLLTIASNTGLQCLRERKPLESFDDDHETADEFHPRLVRAWANNPEQLYSEAERREIVERAVTMLPAKYRVVLVLRDIEQLSTGEAAVALDLGIPTLKSRLLRARLMLREALAPHFATSAKRMSL